MKAEMCVNNGVNNQLHALAPFHKSFSPCMVLMSLKSQNNTYM